jgi:hypothetical protein
MKLKHLIFIATIFAVVSAACNLPFSLRGNAVPTFLPTNPPVLATPTSTLTETLAPTLTSPIVLVPSATASLIPLPTRNLAVVTPTLNPTMAIPITGSGTQSTPVPVTFAPTANPLKIFVGSCGTNQTTITVVTNRPEIVGSMLLLDRLDQLPDGSAGSFGTATTMKAIDTGKYQATITAPSAKADKKEFDTVLDYKFAILDIAGKLVASSFVYNNIVVTVCKK